VAVFSFNRANEQLSMVMAPLKGTGRSLVYVQRRNTMRADVKPRNILVTEAGCCGCAKPRWLRLGCEKREIVTKPRLVDDLLDVASSDFATERNSPSRMRLLEHKGIE
jgi:hypothetical protein